MRRRRTPKQNHLLAALPAAELKRLAPHLERVPLPLGEVIYESGGEQCHVYFPASGIVSLLYVMNDGAAAEIAVVGNEGMVGIALFMGGGTTPRRAVVQSAGSAYRLEAPVLKAEFARGGALQRLLLRYTQALITQMTQTAVCNRSSPTCSACAEAAGGLQADGLISYRRAGRDRRLSGTPYDAICPGAVRPSSHSTASGTVSKTQALSPIARNACCASR